MTNLLSKELLNVDPISNGRILGLDFLKGLAALLVCMLHFLHADFGRINPGETYIPNFTKVIYGFCACSVPLFFMINGQLLLSRPLTANRIIKKIRGFLKIRFVWGIILGLVICLIQSQTITISSLWHYTSYLWFFEALAVIYILILFWGKIKSSKWAIVLPLTILCFPFIGNFVGLLIVLFEGEPVSNLGHMGLFRLYGILYFLLPYYSNSLRIPKLISILLIIIGLLFIAIEVFVWSNNQEKIYEGMNACFPTIGALILTIGVYNTFADLNGKPNLITKFFTWMGQNSLGIYLFHMPVIELFNRCIGHQCYPLIINVAICLLISGLSGFLYRKMMDVNGLRFLLKI